MYNLIIVDDESIERRSVALLLKKLEVPVNILEAANGKQALKLLAENPVRIVITDIRMPIMDGLELSSRIANDYPETKIIVYSAFGEFDYAREAIRFGVTYYLLKPIQADELAGVMKSTLEICKNEDELKANYGRLELELEELGDFKRQHFLNNLLRPPGGDGFYQAARAWLLGRENAFPLYLFLVKSLSGDITARDGAYRKLWSEISAAPNDYLNITDDESLCFVYPGRKLPDSQISSLGERLLSKARKIYSEHLFIVVSQAVESPEDIYSRFTAMDDATDYAFFLRESCVVLFRDGYLSHSQLAPFDEGLLDCIYEDAVYRDFDKLKKDFNVLKASLTHSSGFSHLYFTSLLSSLFGKLCYNAGVLSEKDTRVILKEISLSNHIDKLFSYIESRLDELAQNSARGLGGADNDTVQNGVRMALKLIHQNFADPLLSLDYLSERVYLSRSYLGAVFKRETGMSVSKYICKHRLEKAAHLLLTTNIKVADIGFSVGFSSDSYFVSVFGGYYGQSPSKFRKQKGRTGEEDAR